MVEVVYHGHSFVEIVLEQGSILIDPFITGNKLCDVSVEIITKKQILAICLTHGHSDHVGDTIALAWLFGCPIVAMVELCDWLVMKWIQHTLPMNIWWIRTFESWSVKMVRADHSTSTPEWGYAWLAAGLLVVCEWKTVYHAGDTALYTEMKELSSYKIDVALLPIGDVYTMGVDDALIAASYLKARVVVPIHYNTFDAIRADDQRFARDLMMHNYAVPKVLKSWQAVVL